MLNVVFIKPEELPIFMVAFIKLSEGVKYLEQAFMGLLEQVLRKFADIPLNIFKRNQGNWIAGLAFFISVVILHFLII